MLLHAKSAVFSAKSEYLKAQHNAGYINTTVFKVLQSELQDWSKGMAGAGAGDGGGGDKGDGGRPPPKKKKQNVGPEPSCRMMTMMTVQTYI